MYAATPHTKLFNRLRALKNEHRKIEQDIHSESRRVVPDDFKLQRLKRDKLLIRDELMRMHAKMTAARHGQEQPA